MCYVIILIVTSFISFYITACFYHLPVLHFTLPLFVHVLLSLLWVLLFVHKRFIIYSLQLSPWLVSKATTSSLSITTIIIVIIGDHNSISVYYYFYYFFNFYLFLLCLPSHYFHVYYNYSLLLLQRRYGIILFTIYFFDKIIVNNY